MNKNASSDATTRITRHSVPPGNTCLSFLCAGPETGPPIVLIHGLGWDAAHLWPVQMTRLAQAGWRVLAPDLRGNGGSAPIRTAVRIPDLADDVAALLHMLSIRNPVIVGFSMGVMVATDLALRPDIAPMGLVLACGGVTCKPEGEAAVDEMLAEAAWLGPEAFACAQARAIFAPHWAASNPEAVADFKIWRAEMDQESLTHSFRAPYGCDYGPQLPFIACPAAVIVAEKDSFVNLDDARNLASALAHSQFETIPECGHMAPIEAPDRFDDALQRFLTRVLPLPVTGA